MVMDTTNEPVAWMLKTEKGLGGIVWNEEDLKKEKKLFKKWKWDCEVVPLYAHPVKYCPSENNAAYEKGVIDGMSRMTQSAVHRAVEGMAVKDLEDIDINITWNETSMRDFGKDELAFARAILRKAQEK
jgi:hypothetical protein